MKRILLLVTAFMLLSVQGFSQFGIKGGLNFNTIEDIQLDNNTDYKTVFEKKTGYHFGILYKTKIPLTGISFQPELLFSHTNGTLNLDSGSGKSTGEMKLSHLQLPVSIQWGLDLMLLRPYIQVVPYIGYLISSDIKISDLKYDTNNFKYGIGVGAGLDIWKLQVSGRYNWDLGNVADFEWKGAKTFKGGKNKGFELSLAILF